jgi:hypothetical protein
MLDYQTLDRIADSVNPTLGVITLVLALVVRHPGNPPRWAQVLLTLCAVASIYLLGFIDASLKLWPAMGLDFSGHTGVHVAIVVSLWMIDRRFGLAGIGVFVAYAALMLYQQYHTVADIASTAPVTAAAAIGMWWLGKRVARRSAAQVRPLEVQGS